MSYVMCFTSPSYIFTFPVISSLLKKEKKIFITYLISFTLNIICVIYIGMHVTGWAAAAPLANLIFP